MQLVPKTKLAPELDPILEKIILDVGGMKCAGCVNAVERQLTQHPGVKSACVNLATEVAVVESETGAVDADALAQRLTAVGFPTQPRRVSGTVAGEISTLPDPAERQRQPYQTQQNDNAEKCGLLLGSWRSLECCWYYLEVDILVILVAQCCQC